MGAVNRAVHLDERAIGAAVGDLGKPIFYLSGPEPSAPKSRVKTNYFSDILGRGTGRQLSEDDGGDLESRLDG